MGAHSFDDLFPHVGHKIVCVTYGTFRDVWNISVECETCNTVLMDYDYEKEGEEGDDGLPADE